MVVCMENAKSIDCTPVKDVRSQMIPVSQISTQKKSYQELNNRKKDPATYSHATSPQFGGSSYPVAGIATGPSTGGATYTAGAADPFLTVGTLPAQVGQLLVGYHPSIGRSKAYMTSMTRY